MLGKQFVCRQLCGFSVEVCGVIDGRLNAIVGRWSTNASRIICLNLVVARFGFIDEATNGGLIENLAHCHRLHLKNDMQQVRPELLHLSFG